MEPSFGAKLNSPPKRTPGALGVNDQGAPFYPRSQRGLTPGPLGFNDGPYQRLTSNETTICGKDMISQLIDVLELAITINYVMIGTQFESSTEGMEDPSNQSDKNVIQSGKPGKLGKLSASLGRSAKIRSSMSKKLIAAVPLRTSPKYGSTAKADGLASFMGSFGSIARRNRAARELIKALKDEAPSIRAKIPVEGGVLIQVVIFAETSDGNNMAISPINTLGVGKTPLEVYMDFLDQPHAWAPPPKSVNASLSNVYREPTRWQANEFLIWVTEPCITLHLNLPGQ